MKEKQEKQKKNYSSVDKFFIDLDKSRREKSIFFKLWHWYIKHYYTNTICYIKWKLQSIFRGFSDPEWWALDYYASVFMLPRIKHLRNNYTGYPADLKKHTEWKKILDSIIYSLEVAKEDYPTHLNRKKVNYKKVNEGFKLLGERFKDLWD